MSLIVLDTDVASSLVRRRTPETLLRRFTGNVLGITFVTVGELTKWTLVRNWGPRKPGRHGRVPRSAGRVAVRP